MRSLRLPLNSTHSITQLPRDMRLSILSAHPQYPRIPALAHRNASSFTPAPRPRASQSHHITASPTFPLLIPRRFFTELERETIKQIKKARLRSNANSLTEEVKTLGEEEIKRIYSSGLNPETKINRYKDMNGSNTTGPRGKPELKNSKTVSEGKVDSSMTSTSEEEPSDYRHPGRSRRRVPTSRTPYHSKVSTVEVIRGVPFPKPPLEDRISHTEGTDYSFSIQNWANRVPDLNSSSSSTTTSDTTFTSSQPKDAGEEESYAFTIERRKQPAAEPYNFTIARKPPTATVTEVDAKPSTPEERKELKRKEKFLENPPLTHRATSYRPSWIEKDIFLKPGITGEINLPGRKWKRPSKQTGSRK